MVTILSILLNWYLVGLLLCVVGTLMDGKKRFSKIETETIIKGGIFGPVAAVFLLGCGKAVSDEDMKKLIEEAAI